MLTTSQKIKQVINRLRALKEAIYLTAAELKQKSDAHYYYLGKQRFNERNAEQQIAFDRLQLIYAEAKKIDRRLSRAYRKLGYINAISEIGIELKLMTPLDIAEIDMHHIFAISRYKTHSDGYCIGSLRTGNWCNVELWTKNIDGTNKVIFLGSFSIGTWGKNGCTNKNFIDECHNRMRTDFYTRYCK